MAITLVTNGNNQRDWNVESCNGARSRRSLVPAHVNVVFNMFVHARSDIDSCLIRSKHKYTSLVVDRRL